MIEQDIPPGGFIDESGVVTAPIEDDALREKARIAYDRKQTLIRQALAQGKIAQEYAALLQSMQTATADNEVATLEKVEASLQLKDELAEQFKTGRVAYMGSGTDWQFAVALGGRQIDMVDEVFAGAGRREELLESIQEIDPHATLNSDGIPTIQFGINLGKGVESIELKLFGTNVTQYNAPEPLTGVVEFAGPTKGFVQDQPILPNVASKLSPGARILNFDYMKRPIAAPTPQGFESKSVGKFTILSAVNH